VLFRSHPLIVELTQHTLSLITYRRLLIAYFHLYSALEGRINRYLKQQSCTFPYTERNKLPWLMNDLSFFHDAPDGFDHQTLAIPEIERIGQLVGVLYTIEGATLGGQVISRCLAEHHGLGSTGGACFFNGYGERTPIMWQDFLCFAESISDKKTECAAAVESACHIFKLFEQVIKATVPEKHFAVHT
jgi:heme oxygenase (biliverdin-IX-beta and delta-forming)